MLSNTYWMRCAIELAKKAASKNEVPVAALLIQNDLIVAQAFNQVEKQQNPLAHAEILVLQEFTTRSMNKWSKDLKLVVTMEPCLMCYGAIILARIQYLVYGATDLNAGFSTFIRNRTELNHVPYIIPCVEEEACAGLLKEFFKAKRRGARVVEGGGLENR